MTAAFALVLAGAAPAQAQFEDPEFEEDEFEEPEIDEPEVDEPEVEEPEIEEPEIEEPEVDEPEIDEPEIDEPEIEEPEIEEPEVDEPEIDEPEIEEPEVEEPEVEEPEVEDVEVGENDDNDFEHAGDDDDFDDADSSDDDDLSESGDLSLYEGADHETGDFESAGWLADLAGNENPEFDEAGFPVVRSEIIAIDLSDEAEALLAGQGFVALETTELAALDTSLTRLAVPEGASAQAGLAQARALDAGGIYDLGHYYGAPFAASGAGGFSVAAQPATERAGATANLRIGLIDSGVERAGPLRQVAIEQQDFGSRGRQAGADHGTAVAAILNRFGAGELVVANVFEDDGRGNFTSAETISRALGWLAGRGLDVVNVSLAGPRNAVLDVIVDRAVARGTVIVAAAGNNGPTAPPAYPAALPGVVAVTAVDARHRIYRYANRGDYIDLAAHGVQVAIPLDDRGMRLFTGTSFAAPRVAARLAACRTAGDSAEDCLAQLASSAVDLGEPGRDDIYGFGYVD